MSGRTTTLVRILSVGADGLSRAVVLTRCAFVNESLALPSRSIRSIKANVQIIRCTMTRVRVRRVLADASVPRAVVSTKQTLVVQLLAESARLGRKSWRDIQEPAKQTMRCKILIPSLYRTPISSVSFIFPSKKLSSKTGNGCQFRGMGKM